MATNLEAAQVGAYIEVQQEVVQASQVGIYVESSQKVMQASQIGIYAEILQEVSYDDERPTDDVQEADDGSGYIPNGNFVTIESNNVDSTRKNAAFRFDNINVPQGASIVFSALVLHAVDSTDDDIYADIYGEAADDSDDFSSTPNINSRKLTNNSVSWVIDNAGETFLTSPNIKKVAQEIISRQGWIRGNALTIIVKGKKTDNKKYKAKAKELLSGAEERLYLYYTTDVAQISTFKVSISL